MLHNEYVTRPMFDAITSHPNVIYLYPNALYAEIEVNYIDENNHFDKRSQLSRTGDNERV